MPFFCPSVYVFLEQLLSSNSTIYMYEFEDMVRGKNTSELALDKLLIPLQSNFSLMIIYIIPKLNTHTDSRKLGSPHHIEQWNRLVFLMCFFFSFIKIPLTPSATILLINPKGKIFIMCVFEKKMEEEKEQNLHSFLCIAKRICQAVSQWCHIILALGKCFYCFSLNHLFLMGPYH